MTEIIFTFPVRRTTPLSCVWIETGNPAQPLISKWISRPKAGADLTAPGTGEPEDCRPCA
jgi:hypothetical protein